MVKVGLIIGSLRENSFSGLIADKVASLFPEGVQTEKIELGHLPFYNQDLDTEGNVPEEYVAFREEIKGFDAFLIVTPEYNRTIPAVLKNALEVGSRPVGDNAWNHKPAAIISQSPGNLGGFGANHHLRQILTGLNMPILQQPEAYISNIMNLLDDNGELTNEGTVAFLQSFADAFVALIEKY